MPLSRLLLFRLCFVFIPSFLCESSEIMGWVETSVVRLWGLRSGWKKFLIIWFIIVHNRNQTDQGRSCFNGSLPEWKMRGFFPLFQSKMGRF